MHQSKFIPKGPYLNAILDSPLLLADGIGRELREGIFGRLGAAEAGFGTLREELRFETHCDMRRSTIHTPLWPRISIFNA